MIRQEPLTLSLILVVGLVLRLHFSTQPPYWFDECLSAAIAELSIKDIIGFSLQSHPPFYALLLSGWRHLFGNSDIALRSLSVTFGTLTIPITYLLARKFFNSKWAILTSIMVAICPDLVRISAETRMYSLLGLLGVVSTWLLLRSLETPNKMNLFLYALTSLLGLYTHFNFCFLLFAHFILCITNHRRLLFIATVFIPVGILFSPWIFVILGRYSKGAGLFQTDETILRSFITLPYMWLTGGGFISENIKLAFFIISIILVCVVTMVLVKEILASGIHIIKEFSMIWACFTIPIFVGAIFSNFIDYSIIKSRYICYAAPFSALILASIVYSIKNVGLRRILFAAIFCTLGISTFSGVFGQRWYQLSIGGGDFRQAAKTITDNRNDDQLIVVTPGSSALMFLRYYNNNSSIIIPYPKPVAILSYMPEEILHVKSEEDLLGEMRNYSSIWFVSYGATAALETLARENGFNRNNIYSQRRIHIQEWIR